MPIQYTGIVDEHTHTRQAVSVFDICHMAEFMLEADAQASGLDNIVTQEIISMPTGACRYGFMLNQQGGVIDDLLVYRLKPDKWMLVVNAATFSADEAHLRSHLTGNYRLTNAYGILGKLDVQGPVSAEVLKELCGDGIGKLDYYTLGWFTLWGEDVIISRTGYTGELGFELYLPVAYLSRVWQILVDDTRVKPAGLGCRDTLRLEMGYPLYGHDLDVSYTPLEAGLTKFVDFSKDFIGKPALLNLQKTGINKHLVYFLSDSRRSPRHGYAIYYNGSCVGTITSGSFSPSLSVGIGMGYVSGELPAGTKIFAKQGNIEIPLTIVERPFYKMGTARS